MVSEGGTIDLTAGSWVLGQGGTHSKKRDAGTFPFTGLQDPGGNNKQSLIPFHRAFKKDQTNIFLVVKHKLEARYIYAVKCFHY